MIDGAGSASLMLVLLLALVLISRLRPLVNAENRMDLYLISGGIAVLSLCELLVNLEQSLLQSSVPFLSNGLFHQLTVWIGIITGSILVVAGASRWMPAVRKLNSHRDSEIDNSLLMRVEKISHVEHRPQELIKLIFEMICRHLLIEQGLGLIYSNSAGCFYPAITLGGCSGEFLEQIEKIQSRLLRSGKLKGHSVEALTDNTKFVHAFAIHASGKLCGVYVFWTAETKLSHSTIRQIRAICEIVGRAADQSRLMMNSNHATNMQSLTIQACGLIDTDSELPVYISRLSDILKRFFECDYVSLSLFDENCGLERISIGSNGSLLKETGLEIGNYVDEVTALFNQSRSVLITDCRGFATSNYARVLVNSGMRSIMALKLKRSGKMLGVLLIASHEAMRYSQMDLSLFEVVAAPVKEKLAFELKDRHAETILNLQRRLNEFFIRLQNDTSGLDWYREAANLISDSLNVDLVRISLLDGTKTRLVTKAEVLRRRLDGHNQGQRMFNLADLPIHRRLIDQSSSHEKSNQTRGIIEGEKSFWFEGVESTIVIPIFSAGEVAGTISVGHSYSLGAIEPEIKEYMQTTAHLLGLWTTESLGRQQLKLNSREAMIGRINRERREQIMRSSLSGILGSLEMINGDAKLDETKRKRFLEIIDRSARKLERNLELTR